MVIWKHELKITDRQTVPVPESSTLLCVQKQGDRFFLWFLCRPELPQIERAIAVYGTGNRIPGYPGLHIDTVQSGVFVWHFFDLGEVNE